MSEQTNERYCVLVNGHAVEPGCWVDGHWGQYGPDHLADRAEELGWEPADDGDDDPRHWRQVAEALMDANPREPFCVHCRVSVFFDDETSDWRHEGHEGETCGELSPDTTAVPTWPAASAWESHVESADDIEAWLNEHTTTEGYSWGWWEGEFYLWDSASWEEWG